MKHRLMDVLAGELVERGYKLHVHAEGAQKPTLTWEFPDGQEGSILAAIVHCAKAEDDMLGEKPLEPLDKSQLGPFARGSSTSQQAALGAYPRQGSQRLRVLQALENGGPVTREQLAHATGLSENTIRPRVKELIEGGWVMESGLKRLTTRGAHAAVLWLTSAALSEMGEKKGAANGPLL